MSNYNPIKPLRESLRAEHFVEDAASFGSKWYFSGLILISIRFLKKLYYFPFCLLKALSDRNILSCFISIVQNMFIKCLILIFFIQLHKSNLN